MSHGCRINYLFPKVIDMVPELAILEKLMSNRPRSEWVGENFFVRYIHSCDTGT